MATSIKIIVDHKGNILADFDGFGGTECLEAERQLQDKLLKYGVQISERNAVLKEDNEGSGQRVNERRSLWKKI
ncbi:MAG: hypothetical protein FJ123_00965 [Deltaproteobacteria bacterium]|nr:hypothetical protein [Deltaproteobacteria bacterium]